MVHVAQAWTRYTLGPRLAPSISPFRRKIIDGYFSSACSDNIRLWNAAEAGEGEARGRMQFKIIPGHHGGMVSQMCEFNLRSWDFGRV
jgi:hypothetical protein